MHAFCIIILVIIFLILDKLGIVCLKGSRIYKQLIIITHYTERKKEMKKWRKKIAVLNDVNVNFYIMLTINYVKILLIIFTKCY